MNWIISRESSQLPTALEMCVHESTDDRLQHINSSEQTRNAKLLNLQFNALSYLTKKKSFSAASSSNWRKMKNKNCQKSGRGEKQQQTRAPQKAQHRPRPRVWQNPRKTTKQVPFSQFHFRFFFRLLFFLNSTNMWICAIECTARLLAALKYAKVTQNIKLDKMRGK